MIRLFLALAALVVAAAPSGFAQSTVRPTAVVVTACGTAPNSGYATVGGQQMQVMDVNGNLCVGATVSATATTTATASATPTAVSAGTGKPLNIDLNSALFSQLTFAGTPVDGTHGLPINCIVGCAGGTASNASSGVATSSTNGTTNAWLYGFNGTSWDQLQVDGSKNLKVTIIAPSGALAAGAGADGWNVTEGTKADSAYAGSGSASVIAALKGIYAAMTSAIPAGSATIGGVTSVLGTTNGWTPLRASALTNTAVAIKSSAGEMGMLQCGNSNASEIYIQLFNVAAGSVTVGTTAPTLSIPIGPTATGGWALANPGINFSTAMSLAATTTAAGGTAPATAADCNIAYN